VCAVFDDVSRWIFSFAGRLFRFRLAGVIPHTFFLSSNCKTADKILINVLSVSLWVTGTLPTPLVALWLAKDVALMTATYRYVQTRTKAGHAVSDPITTPLQVNPTTIAKVNTALQFGTLALAIVHPALQVGVDASVVMQVLAGPALPALCWVTGATSLGSFASYAFTNHAAFVEVVKPKNNYDDKNVDDTIRKDNKSDESSTSSKTDR